MVPNGKYPCSEEFIWGILLDCKGKYDQNWVDDGNACQRFFSVMWYSFSWYPMENILAARNLSGILLDCKGKYEQNWVDDGNACQRFFSVMWWGWAVLAARVRIIIYNMSAGSWPTIPCAEIDWPRVCKFSGEPLLPFYSLIIHSRFAITRAFRWRSTY